jgi:prepilin-type N-terminal cleavage/methylation domain-containing protein
MTPSKRGQVWFRPAFSLVELLLVVSILAVMAALAVPRYVTALDDYRAEHAARRIASDIAAAQSTARATATSQSITFSLDTDSYQLPAAVAGNSPATITLRDAPFNADLTAAAFAPAGQTQTSTTLTFNGFGVANAGGSLTVRAGGSSRTISVEQDSGTTTTK